MIIKCLENVWYGYILFYWLVQLETFQSVWMVHDLEAWLYVKHEKYLSSNDYHQKIYF